MILRYFIIDFVFKLYFVYLCFILLFLGRKKKETIGEEKKEERRGEGGKTKQNFSLFFYFFYFFFFCNFCSSAISMTPILNSFNRIATPLFLIAKVMHSFSVSLSFIIEFWSQVPVFYFVNFFFI